MESLLLTAGSLYCFGFAAFHVFFWKIFRWRQDLHRLTPVNRAITQVMNLRLIYVFLFFGIVSFAFQDDLLKTSFGNFILLGISVFWIGRAIEQIVFFDFRQSVSQVLFGVFLIGGALFAVPMLL